MIPDDIIEPYRHRLLRGEFNAFEELASLLLNDDTHDAESASQLEALLSEIVERFAQKRKFAATAAAIDAYVAAVWPRLRKYGLGVDRAAQIAAEARVSGMLSQETSVAFDEFRPAVAALPPPRTSTPEAEQGAERGEPAKPRPKAPKAVAQDDQQSRAEDQDVAAGAIMDLASLYENLTRKNRHKLFKVLIIGQATCGKSFFLERLKSTAARDFTVGQVGSLGDPSATFVDRTKDVTVWRFSPVKTGILRPKRKNVGFYFYDIPGEFFRRLTSKDVGLLETDQRKAMYALLAAIDALVIIEPALHALELEKFKEDGDDLERRTLEFALADRAARLARHEKAESEEEIHEAIALGRKERAKAHTNFVFAIDLFVKTIDELRERVKNTDGLASKESLSAMIDAFIETYDYETIVDRPPASIGIPALLLLSRADEYRRIMNNQEGDFDQDPALTMLTRDQDRFHRYSARFDSFAVDFLTAGEMEKPKMHFDKDLPFSGFTALLTGWLLPAILDARQPRWRKWLNVGRWLRHPTTAIFLRRRRDPEFNREYEASGKAA